MARIVDSITLDTKLGDIVNAVVVVMTDEKSHDEMKNNNKEDMFDPVVVVVMEFFDLIDDCSIIFSSSCR